MLAVVIVGCARTTDDVTTTDDHVAARSEFVAKLRHADRVIFVDTVDTSKVLSEEALKKAKTEVPDGIGEASNDRRYLKAGDVKLFADGKEIASYSYFAGGIVRVNELYLTIHPDPFHRLCVSE
jgi:hypothetical protein